MTKDEFLDGFMKKAGIPQAFRTEDGVRVGSFHRIAVPCELAPHEHTHYLEGKGQFVCGGWVLVNAPKTPAYRGGEYKVTTHA